MAKCPLEIILSDPSTQPIAVLCQDMATIPGANAVPTGMVIITKATNPKVKETII